MPQNPMPPTELARLQRLLISKAGLAAGGADGSWGPQTKAAFDRYLAAVLPPPAPTPPGANGFSLSESSRAQLVGVKASLISLVDLSLKKTTQDFEVVDGLRTIKEQEELVAKGASKTMDSKHLPQADGFGHAVDLVPYVNGTPRWEWDLIWPVAAAVQVAARELGIAVVWGAVWDRKLNDLPLGVAGLKQAVEEYKVRHAGSDFLDGPHYQLA